MAMIEGLYRYPVKGVGSEPLGDAVVGATSRRFCDANSGRMRWASMSTRSAQPRIATGDIMIDTGKRGDGDA